MAHYDFKKDLPIARKTEKQVANFLIENQGMEFVDECNNADYDIRMRTPAPRYTEITIEIKEDFTCKRTGNIGVEFSSWGRQSGIAISKANYYLYKIHRPDGVIGLYVIGTDKLKRMISNKLYHRIVSGGDVGSDSKNYLFRLDVVKENFKLIGFVPE